ncbi:MAG: flagellar basal body rod protein FlgC [Oligoflexia bacterium]|nr:flagellar basal body rod protein FlgC [Oligoflexia bacterium]
MDFLTGMRVSGSGMAAQRMRMNAISSNIANVQTTNTPEGGAYRRKEVVFSAMPQQRNFGEILAGKVDEDIDRVQVVDIRPDRKGPRLVYDPSHVDANEEGYVAYPDINVMTEMVDMLQASRAYEANISAMNTMKNMALSAIEIGR